MQFTVPQFIEKEAKIVGPLTFKQFLFVGTAGACCIILYFILPPFLVIILGIVLFGGALALIFYKKEGFPLYIVIAKSFLYVFQPKVYLWKKKNIPIKAIKESETEKKRKEEAEEKEHKGPRLKVSNFSRLNDLLTHIETKQ